MVMFFKDLYCSVFTCCRISEADFNINKDKCVNKCLAELYMYLDVAIYGYDIGYLSFKDYSKLLSFIWSNIDKCQTLIDNLEVACETK